MISNNGIATAASRSPSSAGRHTNDRPNAHIRRDTNVRGRAIDGTWHCDCEPRLPAVHFQTRNGGKHHGRWFYTCQKPQNKRCGFFLWDDDARAREMMSGGIRDTNGNRGAMDRETDWEGDPPAPKTPSKKQTANFSRADTGLLTPETGRKRWRDTERGSDSAHVFESPTKMRRNAGYEQDEDPFEGSEGLDEEFASGNLVRDNSVVKRESPSPGAYRPAVSASRNPPNSQPGDAPFQSPVRPAPAPPEPSSCPPFSQGETFPSTPTPTRFNSTPRTHAKQPQSQTSAADAYQQCPLVSETLTLLDSHHISVPSNAKEDLVNLLNTHDLRTKGIIRGRDISRIAIKKKEERIQELVGRIDVLEAEREAWKASSINEKDVKKEPD